MKTREYWQKKWDEADKRQQVLSRSAIALLEHRERFQEDLIFEVAESASRSA